MRSLKNAKRTSLHRFATRWSKQLSVLLLIAFVWCWADVARAQTPVNVVPEQQRISLARHVEVFEDHTRQASFAQVEQARFHPPEFTTASWIHLGRSDAVIWLRFRLRNPTHAPARLFLEPAAPFIDWVGLYQPGKGLLMSSGDRLPISERARGTVVPRFDIDVPPSSEVTYYLRVDTSGNLLLPLSLEERRRLQAKAEGLQRWTGAVLGLLAVTAGFFLLTFLTTRRRAYALYSVHVLTSIAFIAIVGGSIQLSLPVWHSYWTFAAVLSTDLTGLFFLRAFLDTRQERPRLDRILVILGSVIAACILWILVTREQFEHGAFVHALVSSIALVQAGTAVFEGLRGPLSRQLYACTWVAYFVIRFAASLAIGGSAGLWGFDPTHAMMVVYSLEAALTGLALVARVREDQLALAESERRLAELIRESPDGIVLLRANKCVAANPAAEQIFELSKNQLLGRLLSELGFTQASYEDLARAQAHARAGSVGAARECTLNTGGGQERYVDANFRQVADSGGTLLVQMTLRDVTERLEAQRASRLAEARAQQAERLEAVGRLAGGVAHDFNNILTVILGNAELLRLDHEAEELDQIINAAQAAQGLTQQLLTFSKGDATPGASADLNRLVEDTQRLLRPLLSEKIALKLELASDIKPVRGDRGQLQQVLINLCVNARDAMSNGGVVTLRTESVPVSGSEGSSAPQEWVRLSVTDTGAGMDDAAKQRVFEPFFSTKPKGRGTGLGLATVFGIVRGAGGEIRLSSELGKGSCFEIDLPVAKAGPLHASPSAHPRAAAPATLLLVEDEADVLRVTKKVLESAGHEVLAAGSPEQARDLVAREGKRIDAIITDVVMPGTDGPALARELTERLGPVPVLYVSGYMPEEVGHDLSLGVNCLQKPVEARRLLQHVADLLENRPAPPRERDPRVDSLDLTGSASGGS